ncbi:STAS/SEC14 domain-containing protein [Polyangium aurulentum]|uniref:STAS/SEC14 domain-containing protein n=1 Tax=Polyangium aurulentum TaxID=2567896 RepID=UPI0010AE1DBF|nr:STAS/SEC14 domain-containing protein [Polyangium aurulentum]UQA56774.1 STAS/SEC14 domain-containing protein [Polyangium aurulentum]
MSEVEALQPQVIRVGAHEVCVEEPDFTAYRLRGVLSSDDVRAMTEVERVTWQGRDRVYLIMRLHNMSLQPGVLLMTADLYRDAPTRVVAVVGASFSLWISIEMFARSMKLLGKRVSMRNFPDEASARAWLQEQRDRPSNAGRKSRPSAG